MKGIILVLLVQISFSRSLPLHRHKLGRQHERRHLSPVKILALSLNGILDDAANLQYNIRCRMDPGTCSAEMLNIAATAAGSTSDLLVGTNVNERFLLSLLRGITEFRGKTETIRFRLSILIHYLIFDAEDPFRRLSNKLANDIDNAISATQTMLNSLYPNISTAESTSSSTANADVTVQTSQSSESEFLKLYIVTLRDLINYVSVVKCVLSKYDDL